MARHNHEIYNIAMMHGGIHHFSKHYDFAYMLDESVYELSDDTWHCIIASPSGMAF